MLLFLLFPAPCPVLFFVLHCLLPAQDWPLALARKEKSISPPAPAPLTAGWRRALQGTKSEE
eukprot:236787-Hanusia_phi.AAC.1